MLDDLGIGAERLAAIGELATGVAHEIRNPLSAIRMNVQMLIGTATAEDKDLLETLLQEIDRLELSVEDLMTFARPRDPELEDVDVAAVVQSALELMQRQLDHANVAVQAEIPNDLPAVRGESGRIKQVAINLVINAMNAMARGGDMRVRLSKDDDHLVLDVQDGGEGIAPDVGDHIFDPFVTTRGKARFLRCACRWG